MPCRPVPIRPAAAPTVLLTLVTLAILAGCQSYRPAPLDLRAHAESWESRDPAAPGVAAYARRLADVDGLPATRPYDPADGLSLREAETVALFFNPQLRVARARARVPAAGAAEAGRWQDPELSVNAERIISGVADPWVLGGILNLTLPLSGRLRSVRGQALAEADVARLTALADEARVIAELHERWRELAVLDQHLQVTRQFLTDLGGAVRDAERLRAAGELGPLEARLFRVEQVRRTADLRGLELQRRVQEVAVRALLGLRPDAPVRLVPLLPRVATHVGQAARRRFVEEQSPRLLQARAEYQVAERTLELEVRRQYPDLTVGGGFGTDEGTERLLGGLSIPLPAFNANRRAIAEAGARRDAARAAAEAVYEELVGGLAGAEVALEAARARREFLETDLAPLADEQLADARRLGRLGDAGAVVLLEALTRSYQTKVELLEAVSDEAVAVNRLNALLRPAVAAEPAKAAKDNP